MASRLTPAPISIPTDSQTNEMSTKPLQETDDALNPHPSPGQYPRPSMGSRRSSGTLIIPRDSPTVEMHDEQYEEGDARAMSPRRSSNEIERMGDEARRIMEEQARVLQANLLEIVDRVETVKSEHEKLEGGNKFLQSYIGELMQTSKITSSSASGTGSHMGSNSNSASLGAGSAKGSTGKPRGRTGRK